MDGFFKTFGGTWTYESGENIEESLKELKTAEHVLPILLKSQPTMTFEERGGKIFHRTEIAPGFTLDITYDLDKEFETKDPNDPPAYHTMSLVRLRDGNLEIISRALMDNAVDYITTFVVSGVQLISETTRLAGDEKTGVIGRRIYKKKE